MQLVLFIPDFVLAGEPEVLRSCQVMMAGEQCHRIHDAIERCHVAADAPALQPFRICAHKHTAMRGLEAVPEAMAIGFVELENERGNVSLKVRGVASDRARVIDEPMNTFVAPDDPYEGALLARREGVEYAEPAAGVLPVPLTWHWSHECPTIGA